MKYLYASQIILEEYNGEIKVDELNWLIRFDK